ncbi:MAG: PorP/SprF family type IX secretion system membrane protein [Prevotellaceae bacterium]|jgi:type IX secretion system PorP/SprF family membrane protein|nr:PorP/SprF family type IX secretion system membrane protein [Prevotellaceae bacterium]
MMRKVVVFFAIFCLGTDVLISQTEPTVTQYMLNNSAFNPAAAGEGEMIQLSGLHRISWIGTPNAGQTSVFQVNAPFKMMGTQHAAGIKIKDDRAGQFFYRGVWLQYAYKKPLSNGATLSIGIDLGFLNAGFHGDSIVMPTTGTYHNKEGDTFLQMGSAAGTVFDGGAGIFYDANSFYAGISYVNATNPTVVWSSNNSYKMLGTAYVTGGYKYRFANPQLVLTPSVLVMTNFTVAQVDLSAVLNYNNRIRGGLSYRWGNALGIVLGCTVLDGLSLGYAYDVPFSPINTWGSHEMSVKYEFAIGGKTRAKHKSIRIL